MMSNFPQSELTSQNVTNSTLFITYGSCGASHTKTHSSLVKAQNTYTRNLLCESFQITYDTWLSDVFDILQEIVKKKIFQELWFFFPPVYQQITLPYLVVSPFGYMYCKVQTKLSNDTYIALIKAVVLKMIINFCTARGRSAGGTVRFRGTAQYSLTKMITFIKKLRF